MSTLFNEKLAHFWKDASGAIAIGFVFLALPLILVVGVALDYSQGAALKNKLQIATDAALLAAAKSAYADNIQQAKADLRNYITASIPDAQLIGEPVFDPDGTSVCVTAQASYNTVLMGMFGYPTMQVVSHGCTKFNLKTFEIAIVLDMSTSMSSMTTANGVSVSKIQVAKTAASSLVQTMVDSGASNSVSFSLVPFNSGVKIGTKYANAAFMDLKGKSSIHWQHFTRPEGAHFLPDSKFDLLRGIKVEWAGCVEERPLPYLAMDVASDVAIPDTLFVPYMVPDFSPRYLSDTSGSCQLDDALYQAEIALKGAKKAKVCAYDNAQPTSTSAPGANCNATAIMTLTRDLPTIKSEISKLVANGNTNTLSAFMWGWRTISPNGPFNTQAESETGPQNAKAYGYVGQNQAKNYKAIVFMSDGDNTWSDYTSLGYTTDKRLGASTSTTSVNTYTKQACQAAKDAGVIVYMVGLNTGGNSISAAGKDVLEKCATSADHFFMAETGDQLLQAFNKIASSMTELRLSN